MTRTKAQPWTQRELDMLRYNYKTKTAKELSKMIGRPVQGVAVMASKLGLRKEQHPCKIQWTEKQLKTLRAWYPHEFNDVAALMCGVSIRTMLRKARELGLEKAPDFREKKKDQMNDRASKALKRIECSARWKKGEHHGLQYEFKPGHVESEESKRKRSESLKKAWAKRKLEERIRRNYGINL